MRHGAGRRTRDGANVPCLLGQWGSCVHRRRWPPRSCPAPAAPRSGSRQPAVRSAAPHQTWSSAGRGLLCKNEGHRAYHSANSAVKLEHPKAPLGVRRQRLHHRPFSRLTFPFSFLFLSYFFRVATHNGLPETPQRPSPGHWRGQARMERTAHGNGCYFVNTDESQQPSPSAVGLSF